MIIHFAADEANSDSSDAGRGGPAFGLRPRGVQVLPIVPPPPYVLIKLRKPQHEREQDVKFVGKSKKNSKDPSKVEMVDGFENPNGLPKLPRLGPPSFFDILAPPYYGKSPVDGSRNYLPGSVARQDAGCAEPLAMGEGEDVDAMAKTIQATAKINDEDEVQRLKTSRARLVDLDTRLCSFGPEEYPPSRWAGNDYAAYVFHEVCMTFNTDSSKKVQRGLIYFDPRNQHPKRCVACPNPIEMQRWGDHACGLMWNHQINAQSLGDYATCYRDNIQFETTIGQRQVPGIEVKGGIFHSAPVLALSFAHKNPGHQMFDSIFSLIPLILSYKRSGLPPPLLAVHQNPSCPNDEWFCAILRRIGLVQDDRLIPIVDGYTSCFRDLITIKWGMARNLPMQPEMLQGFRDVLLDSFGLDKASVATGSNLLLYAHDTKSVEVNQHRRRWLRMREDIESSERLRASYQLRVVDDFAKLTTEEQARSFYEADVVAMPHGGQFGNALFARKGTRFIEIVCSGYSHLGMTSGGKDLYGSIPKALGFVHVVVVPCTCGSRADVDSDFRFGPKSLSHLIGLSQDLSPGTHVAGKLVGKKCFGDET